MTGKEVEERKQTLVDKLKARSAILQQKQMEEICIILVDTSSSMNGACKNGESKMMAVKRSIPYLQARGSYVGYGLVGFGSTAYPIQTVTTSFSTIILHSNHLEAMDQTNIPDAIKIGRQMMEDREVEKKRMILMSDGDNNCSQGLMERMITGCIKEKVVVDCIAFGDHADKNLLRSIATRTGGIFQEALTPEQLAGAYGKLNYQVRYLENKNGQTIK
jgi:Mg-chelatase subunit ChlD